MIFNPLSNLERYSVLLKLQNAPPEKIYGARIVSYISPPKTLKLGLQEFLLLLMETSYNGFFPFFYLGVDPNQEINIQLDGFRINFSLKVPQNLFLKMEDRIKVRVVKVHPYVGNVKLAFVAVEEELPSKP